MNGIKRGNLAALAAFAVLAGVIGWRVLASDGPSAASDLAEEGGMSVPVTLEDLAARAEADPDNAENWQELGLANFGVNRFDEAVAAYERAVAVDPDSAVLWSSLGEARVMASQGDPLPAPAMEAFRRALALDAADPRARYFLAVEKDLGGDHEGAITDWLALLADTPPGAPWENDLVRTIQQVGAINEIAVEERITSAAATRNLLPEGALPQGRGPTQDQMAAAANLSPNEQQSMAEGMVAQLAARIEAQGGSVDEWIMLMRSYQQMGRLGEARRTRERALAAHPDAADAINSAASQLGVSGSN